MVLSLSVPSFSRPTTSSALRASDSSNSTTISEALRNNPFGITSRSRSLAASNTTSEEQKREQEELNQALQTLARIFPDIRIEVFRELLVRFDGQSRLHVCVEQLLRHKEAWVAGRWNVPAGTGGTEEDGKDDLQQQHTGHEHAVPPDELFRTNEYKAAVKAALTKEFNGLSKSTVEAVLAEVNFSYLRARPTLQDLSRRTWRATFNSILPSFKRGKDKNEHPLIVWQRQPDGDMIPRLKKTECPELDRELYWALLAPLLRTRREERLDRDQKLGEELNETEAKEADAVYECECCLDDVTFEQISTCSDNTHIICYGCIRRTIHEALFGQGWGKSVDVEKSTLKCLAPFDHDSCPGTLDPAIVKQAILLDKAGLETFTKFETRLSSEVLLKSQLKLIRCPFCSYAEVDPVYHPSAHGLVWRFRRDGFLSTLLITIFLLDLIPILIIPLAILYFVNSSAVFIIFQNALLNLCLKNRPKKFTCAHPACRRVSCITCQKPWRDPHVCHEPLLLDLRATVEAARTAAVKRTCPRCGLSFVKSSGCNKLTCVCGYSMCYLCRKALGSPIKSANRLGRLRPRRRANLVENVDPAAGLDAMNDEQEAGNDDEFEEMEGYKHFCEHFRIDPGSRCTECNKCELYQDEDEEAVARRAGEKAEREWHARQGTTGVGIGTLRVNNDFSKAEGKRRGNGGLILHHHGKGMSYWLDEVWRDGRWRIEGQMLVDWVVERVLVIDEF
ncbi:E3 ubiquitin-protein ligase [Aspergillus vadensis CBS 113365]|uniref:RING finger protein n=1 Tax=Aspergillus vadensis (strain CBS 113365 / IMI 142717 / IBT 24658) TaxID=1448311 RepID=A0A319C327_ASPVC|nr:RING finger protein [Aspergillus vadensis CBS 113365]PYH72623.1 RING finger protein [Aspergillus vadensis CBS 113365]